MLPMAVSNVGALIPLGRILAVPELRKEIMDCVTSCEILRFERCVCRLLRRSLLIGRPLLETLDFGFCKRSCLFTKCGCDRRLLNLLPEAFTRETEYFRERVLKLRISAAAKYQVATPFVRDRLLALCNSLVSRLKVLDLPEGTVRAGELALIAGRGSHSLEVLSAGLRFDSSAETWEESLPDNGPELQSLLEYKLREGCRCFYDRQAGEHSVGWMDVQEVWHEIFYVDDGVSHSRGFMTALELLSGSNPKAFRHVVTRRQISQLPAMRELRVLSLTGISQSLAICTFSAPALRELSLTFESPGVFNSELHEVEGLLHHAPALRRLFLRGVPEIALAHILDTYPGSMALEEIDLDVIGNGIAKAISGGKDQVVRCPRLQLLAAQLSKIGSEGVREICEAVRGRRLPRLQRLLLCGDRSPGFRPGTGADFFVVWDESLIPSEYRFSFDSLLAFSSFVDLQEIRFSVLHKELKLLRQARRGSDGLGWRVLYLWPALLPDRYDDVVRAMHLVRNYGNSGSPLIDFQINSEEGDAIQQPRPVLIGAEGVIL